MFESIFKIILILILSNQIRSQISLNKDNLANLCLCNPSESVKIDLSNKNISIRMAIKSVK